MLKRRVLTFTEEERDANWDLIVLQDRGIFQASYIEVGNFPFVIYGRLVPSADALEPGSMVKGVEARIEFVPMDPVFQNEGLSERTLPKTASEAMSYYWQEWKLITPDREECHSV